MLTANQDGATGSSPLARGKQRRVDESADWEGLIPARAGKTVFHDALLRSRGAHPRSRGENLHGAHGAPLGGGSSPLARGKQRRVDESADWEGLIPARAGKTKSPAPKTSTPTAHPRSRGENDRLRALGIGVPGSSPLARGKLGALGPLGGVDRLIPARAGKTSQCGPPTSAPKAHPRSRGENQKWGVSRVARLGSSPLARGKPRLSPAGRPGLRLIPARAGKTCGLNRRQTLAQAHPRSRGENIDAGREVCAGGGSSPLARGKRRH